MSHFAAEFLQKLRRLGLHARAFAKVWRFWVKLLAMQRASL
jgi:hypothetical protein